MCVHMYVDTQGRCQQSFSITLHCVLWDRVSPWKQGLTNTSHLVLQLALRIFCLYLAWLKLWRLQCKCPPQLPCGIVHPRILMTFPNVPPLTGSCAYYSCLACSEVTIQQQWAEKGWEFKLQFFSEHIWLSQHQKTGKPLTQNIQVEDHLCL